MFELKLPHIFVITGLVILLGGFSATAAAGENMGNMLLMPIIADENLDAESIARIDKSITKRLKRNKDFKVSSFKDFRKKYGKKDAKKLKKCEAELTCISEKLKHAEFNLVIIGKAKKTGKKWRIATFNIINLDEGEVVRTTRLRFPKGDFDSKRSQKWAKKLLEDPEEMIAIDEDDDPEDWDEEDDEEDDEDTPRLVRREILPSEEEIEAGVKETYLLYVAGKIDDAIKTIATVNRKPCRCDADRIAFTVKAMLEEFKTAEKKYEKAFKKQDADKVLDSVDSLLKMEEGLAAEGQNLGIKKRHKVAAQKKQLLGRAYLIIANQRIRQNKYLEARDYLNKVLAYDPDNAEARKELENISGKYANALFMRAGVEAMSDPDAAMALLKVVLELTEPGSAIRNKATMKMKEVEDMM